MLAVLLGAFAPLVLDPSVAAEPHVTMKAPSVFVGGSKFEVTIEITAPEGGAKLANWMLSPAAFTIDGLPYPEKRDTTPINLPAGFSVSGKIDLSPTLKATRDFELGLSPEIAKAAAQKIQFVEAAPKGLDFMSMPVGELSNWNVMLITTSGNLRLEFWPEVAPNHVHNFLDLAYTGFYDGVKFHRVMPGFMIQGGDPNTKDKDPSTWGSGNGPRTLKAEFNEKKHVRGVLSMARAGHPNYARDPEHDPMKDSASCQFFICHASSPQLDHGYTAFGMLVEGYDALDKIANSPGTPGIAGGGTRPNPPQVIERAIVVKALPKKEESKKQ